MKVREQKDKARRGAECRKSQQKRKEEQWKGKKKGSPPHARVHQRHRMIARDYLLAHVLCRPCSRIYNNKPYPLPSFAILHTIFTCLAAELRLSIPLIHLLTSYHLILLFFFSYILKIK